MKYTKKLSVKSYFINRFGELSTSHMFYQMQEIAWEPANILGFGYETLKKDNQFWVLSRLYTKINRRPVWTENFTLETWSRGTDGFYGYRDFNFLDNSGKSIIQATSSWLILDKNTRRIVKLANNKEFPEYSESLFCENAPKIKSPESDDEPVFTPVLFNEIDINQHFNSGRYIERITDNYSFEFHDKYKLTEFAVNFKKEGRPTDRLAVKKQVLNESIHLAGVLRESDCTDLICTRLKWSKR